MGDVTGVGLVIVIFFISVFRFGQCQVDESVVCGVVKKTIVEIILRGQTADALEHPWHSTIFHKFTTVTTNDWKFMCGGTLINDRFVVTARHCTREDGYGRQLPCENILVKLGLQESDHENEHSKRHAVSAIYTVTDKQWRGFRNDLALIKLSETVEFTSYILPACLVSQRVTEKETGTVVGFGMTDGNDTSTLLRMLRMPVINPLKCIRMHRDFGDFIDENLFCAGHSDGRSVCNGDSGGGLLFLRNGTMQLGGIVSFTAVRARTDFRCKEDGYAVYTSVYSYLPWIERVTTVKGTNNKGYPGVEESMVAESGKKPEDGGCSTSPHGCCPDSLKAASGPNGEGCAVCSREPFGCCPDRQTPAHGPNREGCCLETPYGCCPDNINPARQPDMEGCDCAHSQYGCCPDNTTAARGHKNQGCGCQHSEHGCCPDKESDAPGPNFEGCPCHAFQFGCCPDGVTPAMGPHNHGCHCSYSEFKCCSDGQTPATGPNFEGCTCASSKYGCCPDGVNEAQGSKFEDCEEVPISPQKTCELKKDMGTCHNYTTKYFFDFEFGGCVRFWYGGCGGNKNRFDTAEECKDVCEAPKGKDKCQLHQNTGPCTGYYSKWYYDTDLNTCSKFTYGGCLGTANRFETFDECKSTCVADDSIPPCDQPKERGPCNGTFERWYFDKERDTCEPFRYGGCKGNQNNYPTESSCKYRCKKPGVHKPSCTQPVEEGKCDAKLARWHFTRDDNKCVPFYYTGCAGNDNRFVSLDECEEQCPPKVEKDVCFLPAEIGECQNYTARWYFDTKESRCRQFYHGSCGGNGNNFVDEESCTQRCVQRGQPKPERLVPDPQPQPEQKGSIGIRHCFLAPDAGDRECKQYDKRYHYDRNSGTCMDFTYTGCAGNENNFRSFEECDHACGRAEDVCSLRPAYGRCSENETRWYYDGRSQRCHEFSFSGCHGNANNFNTEQECSQQCRRAEPKSKPAPPTTGSGVCDEPYDYGTSDSTVIVYVFNKERASCEQNYYSGEGGNGNRFGSQEECERQCGEYRGVDVCIDAKDTGPCDEAIARFYYDTHTVGCHPFNYSGCEGNGNRFATIEECQDTCVKQGVYIPPGCTDHPFLARCAMIVQARFCNHKYYGRFCCKSCTLAGQLRH